MTRYSVPVTTWANASVMFETDVDPVADPEGFTAAFHAVPHEYPSVNATNRFDLGDEWTLVTSDDGTVEAYED